jgi:hypothetical protein
MSLFVFLQKLVFVTWKRHEIVKTCLLTYFMVQDILWKADSHSACQHSSLFSLWNPKVRYRAHKTPPLDPTWASRIQFATSIPIALSSILMLSSHLRLDIPSGLFPLGPQPKPYKQLSPPLPHACHMSRSPHPPPFNHHNNIRWNGKESFICFSFNIRPRYFFVFCQKRSCPLRNTYKQVSVWASVLTAFCLCHRFFKFVCN